MRITSIYISFHHNEDYLALRKVQLLLLLGDHISPHLFLPIALPLFRALLTLLGQLDLQVENQATLLKLLDTGMRQLKLQIGEPKYTIKAA